MHSAEFLPGDRWCAIGDSITCGGWYHYYVHLFHATRSPSRRLDLFNCGCNGDDLARVLRRLDRDVLAHRPTVATVMLGLNDVRRDLYEAGKAGAQVEAERREAIETYAANYRVLLKRLDEAEVRAIVLTPSIYDETLADPDAEPAVVGGGAAVALCADIHRASQPAPHTYQIVHA
jgi:endoglucanase